MNEKKELIDWLVLNRFSLDNLRAFTALYKYAGSPVRIFTMDKEEFGAVEGVTVLTWKRLRKFYDRYAELAEQEIEHLPGNGLTVITMEDPEYPVLLKNIFDPPFVLYVKGDLSCLAKRAVAIVGSRFASPTGLRSAKKLAEDLAEQGVLVVSGLARGIDTEAHEGALAKGETCAVLGCGPDVCYPPENRKLFDMIPLKGAIVSEHPPGTKPEKFHFPRRNRVISGLSSGTVVVEASSRSGALITSSFAMEQGRDVFAMPGEINAQNTKGSNNLIRQGAKFVENYLDVLEALEFQSPRIYSPERQYPKEQESVKIPEVPAELTALERKILESLPAGKVMRVDAIIEASGAKVHEAESVLLMLELKDLIRQEPGKRFKRI